MGVVQEARFLGMPVKITGEMERIGAVVEKRIANLNLIKAAAVALAMSFAGGAWAGSTVFFNADQKYRSVADSPFAGPNTPTGSFFIENFEDGLLNTVGVTASRGSVMGPGANTDSVRNDGANGHSFSSGDSKSITFRFQGQGSMMPTMAGLVWTDGQANSKITFRAWNAAGDLIGKIKVKLGDLVRNGTTGEDRFLGISSDTGIAKIQLTSNYKGFEIDHLQYGYSYGANFAVVPLPPAIAMGLAGLAGLGIMRARRRLA